MTSSDRQQRLAEVRSQQAREERIRKGVIVGVIVAVIAVVGFALAMAIKANPPKSTSVNEGTAIPTKVNAQGAFRIGKDGSVVDPATKPVPGAKRAELWFDPMCPGCAAVERAAGARFLEAAKAGEVDLYLNPLSFLDRQSSDEYSTRAVNAFVTVAEKSPEHTMPFLSALYTEENHPEEGAAYDSVSDEDFARIAQSVGVPADVAAQFSEHSYTQWISQHTEGQSARQDVFPEGVTTPTMVIGGTEDGSNKLSGFSKVNFAGPAGPVAEFDKALAAAK